MQRLSRQGTVLIHGSGDFDERRLAQGERMLAPLDGPDAPAGVPDVPEIERLRDV